MRRFIIGFFVVVATLVALASPAYGQSRRVSLTPTPTPTPTLTPTPAPPADLTQKTLETIGPLEKILNDQKPGKIWPTNPLKHAIRASVKSGVPANTIVLLLLLPLVALVIAATRQLIGIRGFGIFLPAALSVVFVATGPLVGIGLFLIITVISTLVRIALRKLKIKLQYLPRMAIIIWSVSLSVLLILFTAPIIKYPPMANVSIFAVLILALLTEDFIRVQLGKSIRTALDLTMETLILALISFLVLTLKPVQAFALLNPELLLALIFVADFILGKYVGLRFMEYIRFRKLISS